MSNNVENGVSESSYGYGSKNAAGGLKFDKAE